MTFESSTIIIFCIETGKIFKWNKAFVNVVGYSKKEIEKLRVPDDLFGISDSQKFRNQNQELENDELYEHYKFTAGNGQEPLRVDKFLMNFIENATRNKIQQAAKAGNILVNDTIVKSNHKVKPNDVVKVVLAYPPTPGSVRIASS